MTSTTRGVAAADGQRSTLGEGVPPGDVYALSMRQADRLVRRLCRAVRTHVDREDDDQDEDEEDHGDGGGGGDDDSGRLLCGKNTMLVVTSDNGPWRVQGAFGGAESLCGRQVHVPRGAASAFRPSSTGPGPSASRKRRNKRTKKEADKLTGKEEEEEEEEGVV